MNYIALIKGKNIKIVSSDKFAARLYLLKNNIVDENDNFIIFKIGEIPEWVTLDIFNKARELFPEKTKESLWFLDVIKHVL